MEDKTFKLIEKLYIEVTGLKSEVTGLKGEFNGLKSEVTGLKGEFSGLKSEVTGLKGEFNGLKDEVTGLKGEFNGFRKETRERFDGIDNKLTFIEQDHGKKLQALFDGYKQHSDQLDRIEEKVSRHDDIIVRKVK